MTKTIGLVLALGLLSTPLAASAGPTDGLLEQRTRPPKKPVQRGWRVGDRVKVMTGPFHGFAGVVRAVNQRGRSLTVEVQIFGKPQRVELRPAQVVRA